MSGNDFFLQGMNLLAQQLATLKGEEIYNLTACMNSEERNVVGVLEALKKLPTTTPALKEKIDKILPFFVELGKARWERTELTNLGLRVGHRNVQEARDE